MSIEFKEFDKIARLRRNVMVTEKIDGTNAAVRWEKVVCELCSAVGHIVKPVPQGTQSHRGEKQ